MKTKKELEEFYSENCPGVTDIHSDLDLNLFAKEPKAKVMHHVVRILNCGYLAAYYSGALNNPVRLNLLDIGAGHGELLNVMRGIRFSRGVDFKYCGMDLDERKKEQYHRLHPRTKNHKYIIQDFRNPLNLKSETINCIVSSETIEHVNKEEGIQLLSEMYRVLMIGGILILTTPDATNYRSYSPYHLHEWESSELQKEIEAAKFSILKKFWYLVSWKDLPGNFERDKIKTIMDPDLLRSVLSLVSEKGSGGIICFVAKKV